MKKLLILVVCCLCLCGCGKEENSQLLIGDWIYEFENSSIKSYEFSKNGTVKYFECYDLTLSTSNDACKNGSAVWKGNYTLKNDIVEFSNFKIDKSNSYNPTSKLLGPLDKIIIDFNNMYFCERNEGLDCIEKYEKGA